MSRATSPVRNRLPPPSLDPPPPPPPPPPPRDSNTNFRSSPVKQSRRVTGRSDIQASSNVRNAPQDTEFHLNHLNQLPSELLEKLRCLTPAEEANLNEVVTHRTEETPIYEPLAELLTSLSKRIYDNLPDDVKDGLQTIEFIPNNRKLMTAHPGKDYPTSYAPDLVGVAGSRDDFKIEDKESGVITWQAIPYHRAISDVEVKSSDKGHLGGTSQVISYTWYHMQACHHLPGVYCLSVNPQSYTIGWVDASGPVRSAPYLWETPNDTPSGDKKKKKDVKTRLDNKDQPADKSPDANEHYRLSALLSYLYSLYVPKDGHLTYDSTIKQHYKIDSQLSDVATWDITCEGTVYQDCKLISCYSPWGRRTAIFEHREHGNRTIIKDYWFDTARRFNELEVLAKVHSHGKMPGVVRAVHSEYVRDAEGNPLTTGRNASTESSNIVENRKRVRLVFDSVGEELHKVRSLKELLSVFFDLNEAHRAVLNETGILHRDISPNNILIHPVHSANIDADVQYNDGPKFISDILCSPSSSVRESDTSQSLLIDFDNSADLNPTPDEGSGISKVLAQRTGTPMYIARAVSTGHRMGQYINHRTFSRMPELTGKAKMLYEATWGTEMYKKYCDDPQTCHGAIVPTDDILQRRWREGKLIPTCHKPHHDVESMFWSLYVTSMQVVPKCDVPDIVEGPFALAWTNLSEHRIHDPILLLVDVRDTCLRSLPDDIEEVLHPGFSTSQLPQLLRGLCAQITPEYDLLEGIDKPDHLHEAMRRLLLNCIVEMEDKPDIQFDTEKRRTPYYLKKKRGRDGRGNDDYDGVHKRTRTAPLDGEASQQFLTRPQRA